MKIYRPCTGCYNSIDGYPDGEYPIHPKHGCYVGAGCRECRGRGFVRNYFMEDDYLSGYDANGSPTE